MFNKTRLCKYHPAPTALHSSWLCTLKLSVPHLNLSCWRNILLLRNSEKPSIWSSINVTRVFVLLYPQSISHISPCHFSLPLSISFPNTVQPLLVVKIYENRSGASFSFLLHIYSWHHGVSYSNLWRSWSPCHHHPETCQDVDTVFLSLATQLKWHCCRIWCCLSLKAHLSSSISKLTTTTICDDADWVIIQCCTVSVMFWFLYCVRPHMLRKLSD